MEKIGPLVGRGYIAEVFAYGEDKVVKLFLEEDKTEDAAREARATAIAWESGLPAPKIWEVVTVNGRVGIVMERVEGVTMLHWGTSLPWRIYTGAKMMARMHADMHSRLGGDIPDLRDRLKRGIEENEIVEEGLRSLALERLVSLPDGDSICHGDFHPDNIMMSDKGPVIIDWQTGVRGHPAADVARTVVLVRVGYTIGVRCSQSGDRVGAEDIPLILPERVFQDYGHDVGGCVALAAANCGELRQRGFPGTGQLPNRLCAAVYVGATTTVHI